MKTGLFILQLALVLHVWIVVPASIWIVAPIIGLYPIVTVFGVCLSQVAAISLLHHFAQSENPR